MSYLGNSPGVASQRIVTSKVATEGQTRIATDSGYVKGYVDVVINGIDMVAGFDFTEAGDGINIDMAVPLRLNDNIKIVAYIPRGLSDGYLKSEADALLTKTLGLSSFRNRIINGDMKVSQRGVSFAAANGYTLDRFLYSSSGISVATVTQSTDVPANSGLSNSLRVTVTAADTILADSDYALIRQSIEGYYVADLVGVPIILSFWVKSSKAGTHSVKLRNSASDKAYVTDYIVNVANTWEKKSITIISGLPSDGVWDFSNGAGLLINWALAAGSANQTTTPDLWLNVNPLSTPTQVNCLDTIGNIFAITGVQLEKGETVTDFEFRPVTVELALCQRYFWKATGPDMLVHGYTTAGNRIYTTVYNPVRMRASPLISLSNFANSNCNSAVVNTAGAVTSLLMANVVATGAAYSQATMEVSAEI